MGGGVLTYRKQYGLLGKFVILGVASVWDARKGLPDLIQLAGMLDDSYRVVLIGLTKLQREGLPDTILCVEPTADPQMLAAWYRAADVFVNPTYEDNYPTVNLEALACGTPVITYDTGGSAESLSSSTGISVPKGCVKQIRDAVIQLRGKRNRNASLTAACSRKKQSEDYLRLYQKD